MRIILFSILIVLVLVQMVYSGGDSHKKTEDSHVRQKRQYLGYPYGFGYPYSYGFGGYGGYNPYFYRPPVPYYGMPYYRPYGYWGR